MIKKSPLSRFLPAFAAFAVFGATPAFALHDLSGKVTFADGSPCTYQSPLFSKSIRGSIQYLEAGSLIYTTAPLTPSGAYSISASTVGGSIAKLHAVCDGLSTADADVSALSTFNVTLPNSPPRVTSFTASSGGQAVKAAVAGTTLQVAVQASDADGNALAYQWFANAGTVVNTNNASTTWKLPSAIGTYFLYVLVTDGHGGYDEEWVNVSVDTVQTAGNSSSLGLPNNTFSAKITDHAHFLSQYWLNSRQQDTRRSACQYYKAIGAVQDCTSRGVPVGTTITYSEWRTKWGLTDGRVPNSDVNSSDTYAKAQFANLVDLNLQRDHQGIVKPSGRPNRPNGLPDDDAAFVVCNYPNAGDNGTLANLTSQRNLVACVAMEYSMGGVKYAGNRTIPDPTQADLPYVKFITFAPDGSLYLSVNLDGRGEKFLPGACTECHGGTTFSSPANYSGHFPESGTVPSGLPFAGSPAPADLNASFLPFDLDNFFFPASGSLTFANQQDQLRKLNWNILRATAGAPGTVRSQGRDPNSTLQSLIYSWYGNTSPNPLTGTFDGSHFPPGWDTPTVLEGGNGGITIDVSNLYNSVVKPACRTCHVGVATAVANSYSEFRANYASGGTGSTLFDYVCGGVPASNTAYSMPNSAVTFDRFWGNLGQPRVTYPSTFNQSGTLLKYLQDIATADTLLGVTGIVSPTQCNRP